MRKLIVLALLLFVVATPVLVGAHAGENNATDSDPDSDSQNSDNGIDDNHLNNQTDDHTSDTSIDDSQGDFPDQSRYLNRSREMDQVDSDSLDENELHDLIQEREQELEREHMDLSSDDRYLQGQYSNMSAFVYVLHNESERFRGIGPQVSQYATQFNSSLQAQILAQERIQRRDSITRFFVGGDEVAAADLEREITQNQLRIQEMRLLVQQCSTCTPQVVAALENQLQEMEREEMQLLQLAQREKQNKGLFGWLWK
ncbi:MAG: hypothetical protein LUQ17_01520 [Methanomicrobiales archaeon]|nr:hypothetical protein [Methanomicrobiales archaeon]